MALKFNKNRIRLWKGVSKKLGDTTIGIRFNRGYDTKEIYKVNKTIQSILELKYGKGVK